MATRRHRSRHSRKHRARTHRRRHHAKIRVGGGRPIPRMSAPGPRKGAVTAQRQIASDRAAQRAAQRAPAPSTDPSEGNVRRDPYSWECMMSQQRM